MIFRHSVVSIVASMSLVAFCVGSAMWLFGCSAKIVGDGDLPSNERAEKMRFADTVASLGRTQSAVRMAHVKLSVAELTGAQPNGVQPMSSRLLEGKCHTTLRENLTESTSSKSILMQASGSSCPIYMDYKLSLTSTATGSTDQIKIDYTVLDDDYRALNDLDKVNLDFRFDSSIKNTDSGSFSESGTGSGQGVVHSQKLGHIRLLFEAKTSGSGTRSAYAITGSKTLAIFYADGVKIEMKNEFSQSHMGESTKYTMNGNEITEKEVAQYLKQMNLDALL